MNNWKSLCLRFDFWWYNLKDNRLQQCRRLFRFRRVHNFDTNTGFSLLRLLNRMAATITSVSLPAYFFFTVSFIYYKIISTQFTPVVHRELHIHNSMGGFWGKQLHWLHIERREPRTKVIQKKLISCFGGKTISVLRRKWNNKHIAHICYIKWSPTIWIPVVLLLTDT